MNKSKALLFFVALLIGGTFNSQSQTAASDASLIGQEFDNLTQIEFENSKDNSSNPFITEGKYSDDTNISYHEKLLVIYISDTKGSKLKTETYTAQQYAEILQ